MSKAREEFIKKYSNDVILATQGTPIFPSVKMAQFMIESANNKGESGKGITFVKANNGFGIKADKNYKGAKMAFNTPKDGKPINYFRVYNAPIDSIRDHSKFLLENKRYRDAGAFTATTPEDQIKAIAAAGYAEGKNYAATVIALINAYNLKALDKQKARPQVKQTSNTAALLFIFSAAAIYYLADQNKFKF
jgi:flagellum-specific peptidoglycan hydrolase FlgJ